MSYTNYPMKTKLLGFAAAVLMTTAVNGSLLWGADDLAQRGVMPAPALMASADGAQSGTARVELPAVTIHAHKA
jgi:hypothetical protein